MFPKLAAVVVGAGAIGIGGVAFAKPEWLGINRETPWTHLAQDHDYKTKSASGQAYNEKFGSKHKYYLVGVVGTNKETNAENTNKAMWDELFKKWEKDYAAAGENKSSLGQGFSGKIEGSIKVGTGENNKYLNTVCEAIYKTETSNITSEGGTDKYKESLVWKYCSGLGEKPKTISEENKDEEKYKNQLAGNQNPIGKNDAARKKLVSTTGNNKFWETRDKEFKGIDGYEKIDGTAVDAFFKQAPNTKITIRDLCEKAYNSKENGGSASTDTEPKKDQVIKYCSLSKG